MSEFDRDQSDEASRNTSRWGEERGAWPRDGREGEMRMVVSSGRAKQTSRSYAGSVDRGKFRIGDPSAQRGLTLPPPTSCFEVDHRHRR